MDADRQALSAARPSIVVDGQAQVKLSSGLLRMTLEDTENAIAAATLEFGNWGATPRGNPGFLWFDRSLLDFGKAVEVKLGDEKLFEGRISALDGRFPTQAPPTLVVRAEDRLQDLRMTRRSRLFTQSTLSDIARRVAQDHGLTLDGSFSGATLAVAAQVNQSDLAFLRGLALREDADLWVEGTTLKLAARGSRTSSGLTLTWGARLHAFDVSADLAHQRTAVVVGGWDVAGKQALSGRAEAGVLSGEVGQGDSGPAVLQQAFGERVDTLAHQVAFDAGSARAFAEAHLRTLGRRFVRGHGTADLDARLRVGRRVQLDGLGPLFSGEYSVVAVRHRFDNAAGARTEFTAERPALGRP